jgi:hypothetical protein
MPAIRQRRLRTLALAGVCVLICLSVCADAASLFGTNATLPELSGFYKNLFSVTDVRENFQNVGLTSQDFAIDDFQRFRLKLDYDPSDYLNFKVHYEARLAWGEMTRIQNKLEEILPVLPPRRSALLAPQERPRFLDLEGEPISEPTLVFAHGLERLQVLSRLGDCEFSLGRQAVTWGPGLIWNPNDLFSGFAPTEIDRDEKFGVDVARFTWTPAFGTSLDVVAEPLDQETPYRIDAHDSSLALRATAHLGEYDVAAVGGYIAGDSVLGCDFSGYLKDAGWRGELIYTWVAEDDERNYVRGLLSLDYAFQVRWDPYVALEYFYNGLGVVDPDDYLARLSNASVQRAFQRGNAYNIGRHYLGAVGRVLPSALVSLQSVTLVNLLDGSVRELATVTLSLTDNLDFQLGVNAGLGKLGTEFGGYSEDQLGVDFRTPNFVFGFLKYYF